MKSYLFILFFLIFFFKYGQNYGQSKKIITSPKRQNSFNGQEKSLVIYNRSKSQNSGPEKELTVNAKNRNFKNTHPKEIILESKKKKPYAQKKIELPTSNKRTKVIQKTIKKDNPKLISVPYGYYLNKKKKQFIYKINSDLDLVLNLFSPLLTVKRVLL